LWDRSSTNVHSQSCERHSQRRNSVYSDDLQQRFAKLQFQHRRRRQRCRYNYPFLPSHIYRDPEPNFRLHHGHYPGKRIRTRWPAGNLQFGCESNWRIISRQCKFLVLETAGLDNMRIQSTASRFGKRKLCGHLHAFHNRSYPRIQNVDSRDCIFSLSPCGINSGSAKNAARRNPAARSPCPARGFGNEHPLLRRRTARQWRRQRQPRNPGRNLRRRRDRHLQLGSAYRPGFPDRHSVNAL
jgi:hypothetical protein